MPKVLHLPVAYPPWVAGGRETYAHTLSLGLRERGWDVCAVFHQDLDRREPLGEHVHEGVRVVVLPALADQRVRANVYRCRTPCVPGFGELLRSYRPDIVHFHDFSVAANLTHLGMARASGAQTVMTYHSPGQSCLQRELLYRGQQVCDGEIRRHRCTECRLGVIGVPRPLAWILAGLAPIDVGAESHGAPLRAVTSTAMTAHFERAWRQMLTDVDIVHVYADWAAEMLRRNGVPARQLRLIRTGVATEAVQAAQRQRPPTPPGTPLRLAFVGRCEEIKGIQVLIDAVCQLPPDAPIEVSFFGPNWESAFGRRLLGRIQGDRRFREPRLLARTEVGPTLATMDACVVPSLWLETGPLVVLEAFAAGVPVIGSRLGGIAELVQPGSGGVLFEAGNSRALAAILADFLRDPARLEHLRRDVPKPRTMADVAGEMTAIYDELLSTRAHVA